MNSHTDSHWMRHAIALARQAQALNEVPVGAVLVYQGEVLAEAYNQPIGLCDPSAHAEMLALRAGARRLGNYRLLESTLYVTLEPCGMCAGAMVHARIQRLVFGALDPKAGAVISCVRSLDFRHLNHAVLWESGVLARESGQLLQDFFRQRR